LANYEKTEFKPIFRIDHSSCHFFLTMASTEMASEQTIRYVKATSSGSCDDTSRINASSDLQTMGAQLKNHNFGLLNLTT
jgi:hypothetical protein